MVQVKIKNHSRTAIVLAAGSSHSFNRSIRTSFLYFISFTSPTSAPHVQMLRASTPTLFSTHANSIPAYFYLRIVYPIKPPVPDHCRFNQTVLIVPSCYWNENNCSRTSHCQLFPNSTAHHHTWNLTFPFFKEIYVIQRLIDIYRIE